MDCSCKLLVSSIFLILTHFISSVTSLSLSICINNGNYTERSIYSSNLNRSLSSLLTNVNNTGFYYASFGQNQDTANAFVMCRADVSLDTCKNCADDAISEIQSSCPNQKQAVNWQEYCTLKYSNDSMYGKLETDYKYYLWNPQNASNAVQFKQDLENLLKDLSSEASNGGDLTKVATGNVSGPDFQNIYAMVQCKPDLSPDDCFGCLNGAAKDLPNFCDRRIGCRILLESCFLRYERDPFYNETRIRELMMSVTDSHAPQPQIMSPPPPSSPLPPPQHDAAATGKKTRTIVITVIGLLQLLRW